MTITFAYLNTNSNPINVQKDKISFSAGLNTKLAQEIRTADVSEIVNRLAKKGIESDFKDNKVIAWCCDKTVELFQELNDKFNLKLALPKGIWVENFEKLNVDNNNMYAFCNFLPTKLKKKSDEICPGMTLVFNSFEWAKGLPGDEIGCQDYWGNINKISDLRYELKHTPTNHFLNIFLHEFSHVAHENKLLSKFSGETFIEKFQQTVDPIQVAEFKRKYGQKLSGICNDASLNPFEAVACDMSRTIANSLDSTKLISNTNPLLNTPYENLSFWQRVNLPTPQKNAELSLQEILRNFWNGKFE